MRVRIAVLAITFIALSLPGAAGAAQPIQPGAFHQTGSSGCTLNFIYDGSGGPYVGTAAHCVDEIGQRSFDADGALIGTVAAIGNEDTTEDDWALIRVASGAVGRINPAVKGHPAFPTGSTVSSETSAGDVVVGSGYGMVFSITSATRERRPAVLTYDDAEIYTVLGALIFGDSGGPIVHQRSGKALGIVSRLCIGLCEEEGPTVQGIIAKAAAQGIGISVRRA